MANDVRRVPDGTGLSSPTEPQEGLGPAGFDPSRITDERLAEACCPGESGEDKAAFLAALTDSHRETLKRLIWAGDELNAGRLPPGVIACGRRDIR